jgi:hypothetical protein
MNFRHGPASGRRIGLAILLGLGLLGAVQAQNDPPGRVGRVAAVQGEAHVFDAEEGRWVAVLPNRPFTQHDRLATGADGRVEVRIGSTTVVVAGGSEVDATRLDDERLQFALLRGGVALRVRSAEIAAESEVVTPEGRFAPLRAGLYRVDRRDETSAASVWRGELQLSARDLQLTLQPGERADLWFDAARGVMRAERLPLQNDDFAAAVLRDDLAAAGGPSQAYVSPEMTGAEDLERFGRWQQHPEVGPVWIPMGLAPGWAPYRHGRWVWLRPWGWTWIDAAPWGFAPFHYGRWLWWGGNWCWTPGVRVARPVYAPALVGWIGPAPGHAGGVVVGVPGGPRVLPAPAWVPLAPREPFHPWYRASPGYVGRVNAHPAPGPQRPPPAWQNRQVPGATSTLPPRETVAPRAVRPLPAPRVGEAPGAMPGAVPGVAPGVVPGPMPDARPGPMPGRRPGMSPGVPADTPSAAVAEPPVQAGARPPIEGRRPGPPVQAAPPSTGPFGGPVPATRTPRAPVAAPAGAAPAVAAMPPPAAAAPPVAAPRAPAATTVPARAIPVASDVIAAPVARRPDPSPRPAARSEPIMQATPDADASQRRQAGGRLAPRER